MKNKIILVFCAVFFSSVFCNAQAKKMVLMEKKTGTWCGYCPKAAVDLEKLKNDEPNVIIIAIHNDDPMTDVLYDSRSNLLPDFQGYPYIAADRKIGASAPPANSFELRRHEEPVAAISVTTEVVDSYLEITITADFEEAVTGDWRLAAVVTEDNVTGTTQKYGQTNYYSGGSLGELVGAGHEWHLEPRKIKASKMVYQHVARKIADNSYEGKKGSLPESIEKGSTHTYMYSVKLGADWKINNLRSVAMLIEPDGTINNAGISAQNNLKIDDKELSNYSVSAYPNPTADVINLTIELDEANEVALEVVDLVGATVEIIGLQSLAAGINHNQIDLTKFSNGIYFIKTTIAGSVEMTKIRVQK